MNEIKSRADLFEAAAKMMRMCDEAGAHCYAKYNGIIRSIGELDLQRIDPKKFEPFLAIVECKPVFKGDELYDAYGRLVKAEEGNKWDEDYYISLKTDGRWYLLTDYSWLPPKPRTVMVELLREDAEWWDKEVFCSDRQVRVQAACRKALEESK